MRDIAVYLGSLGIFGSVIVSAHAQHVLCAVVELGETKELAVVEVNGRLEDAVQRRRSLIGAVEKGLKPKSAPVKVARAEHVELLFRGADLIPQVCGETGVRQGGLFRLADMLT